MPHNFYITHDKISLPTGGGIVTKHESEAFSTLGPCEVWDRDQLGGGGGEPWKWDDVACCKKDFFVIRPKLCHFYSGTWPKTVDVLKRNGSIVVMTIAAHSVEVSKREHEKLGFGFNLSHLTDPELWKRYIEGYRLADVIVVPGSVPKRTVQQYGPDFENKDIRIIHHGCNIPPEVKSLPDRFTVGYLGSFGADKGVVYLLQAWKKLNYQDATLILGGRDSTSIWGRQLITQLGGGNIIVKGWVNDVSEFYNEISLFCCPAATEGFNCEVLESQAHSRTVICSRGAGAVDLVPPSHTVDACSEDQLAEKIDEAKKIWDLEARGKQAREVAELYTWDLIKQKYLELWKEMIS